MMSDPVVQDDASKALDLLKEHGWFQMARPPAEDDNGSNCMMTAVTFARAMLPQRTLAALANVITEQYPERTRADAYSPRDRIVFFNDHADTTFEDVERVFEKVIAG